MRPVIWLEDAKKQACGVCGEPPVQDGGKGCVGRCASCGRWFCRGCRGYIVPQTCAECKVRARER